MARPKKPSRVDPREWLRFLVPFVFLLPAPALLLSRSPAVEGLQNAVFDAYQRLRPRVYRDAAVRVLDIDDETLAKIGQWPWPRTKLAKVVARARELGVAVLAFDAVFPEPDRTSPRQVLPLWADGRPPRELAALAARLPDHDEILAREIERSRVVLGSVLVARENSAAPLVKTSFVFPAGSPLPVLDEFSGSVVNRPELEKAAAGDGSFTYDPERDGIIRRAPLVQRLRDALVPSLSAEALRVAQGADTIVVKCAAAAGESIRVVKIKIGDLVVPTDAKGRVWIYFTGPAPERTIPLWRILEKDFDPKLLAGTIVFMGTSASGLVDQRATPLAPITPGVEVHAQLAEQAVLQEFLTRPDWAADAEAVGMVVLGALLIVLLQRRGAVWGGAFAAAAIATAFAAGWWAFTRRHLLLDPLLPSLTIALVYLSFALVNYVQGESAKREIRGAFRDSLSADLVERLARDPQSLRVGGEIRRMTFHHCDIEGFASLSEFYDPRGLIRFLNAYLTPLSEAILENHGTIDKYVGDRISAFWNAPLDDPRHAQHACLAALEMHERLKSFNEERRAAAEAGGVEHAPIRLRTGLHSGDGIVGNMGSRRRFHYSALGDDADVAAKLEEANKIYGTRIMASEATVSEARGAVETRPLGHLRLVGKAVPIRVYELLAKKGELAAEWRKALPLYERGLEEYYAREFARAADTFQEVLEILPDDGPSSLYLRAAADFSVLPPPESWDGVLQLKTT